MDVLSGRSYLVLRPFISKYFFSFSRSIDSHGCFIGRDGGHGCPGPSFQHPGGISFLRCPGDVDENAIRLSEFNVRFWH